MSFSLFFAQPNMWQSFVLLFSEMSPIVAILFVLGIILMIAETFLPGIGVLGISGALCFIAAVIIRMVQGGNVYMLVYMLFFGVSIVGGCFWLVSSLIARGKLDKSKVFSVGTALPEGITEGTRDFTYLIGKTGKTSTFLRPIGVAEIEGEVVDVIAKIGIIEANTLVKVISVEGQKVLVEPVVEEK